MIPWLEPPALRIGPASIQAFGLLAALGVWVAVRVTAGAARRRGLDPRPILDFAIWGVVAGIVGGHAVHLVAYHPEELADPLQVLRFWDGLSSYGGLLGGLVAAVVWFRRRGLRLSDYGDSFALGLAAGWGVARIGCFLAHDHPGERTDFPLAVAFPGGARHDLGLYDAVVLLALAALLWVLFRSRRLEGRLLALLAACYGTSRFLLDFLRARDLPYVDARYLGLTPAQYLSVALVAWGSWRLARLGAGPLAPDAARNIGSGGAGERRKDVKILVVEDDAGIRQGIVDYLSLEGYPADVARNGEEALAYLRGSRPSLIVLDLLMPVMTGPQLLARIREERIAEGVPVAIMTAAMPGASALPAADAYLTKPFDLDELLAVVTRLVGPPPVAGSAPP